MIAKLFIQTAARNGKTFLKNSFYSPPFKLADITEDKKGARLHLMIMSSSPGILDNDEYRINIELEEGSSVYLETQSYQRLFHMKTGALQEMQVKMEKNSELVFLPHPCVPHRSSIFSTKNAFHLAAGCNLIWGEVITCGRKLHDEIFRFSRYHSLTEIYFGGKLAVKENLLMAPGVTDVKLIGQMEGYTHQASLICVTDGASSILALDNIREMLHQEMNISFGVSALQIDGFIVRILGHSAEQLFNYHKSIAAYFKKTTQIKYQV